MNIDHYQLDRLGKIADSVDNLVAALKLPMPDRLHLQALREALPELSETIKDLVVEIGGENPWKD